MNLIVSYGGYTLRSMLIPQLSQGWDVTKTEGAGPTGSAVNTKGMESILPFGAKHFFGVTPTH